MSRIMSLLAGVAGIVAMGWVPVGNGFKGTVRNMEFEPVAGAWIEARSVAHVTLDASDFEGEPAQAVRSAVDGSYSLSGLGTGTWIVTAVGSITPRTDDEMKDLARAGAKGLVPAGVAVTRLVRHFDDESHRVEEIDLGLAPAAASSVRGRVVGVFDHEHFAYQIKYSHGKVMHSKPGRHTSTFEVTVSGDGTTSSSSDFTTPTIFSAVPTADGRFDFGSLALDEHASITVTAAPLASDWLRWNGNAFSGPIAKLEHGEVGVEVPLLALRTVTFRAGGHSAKSFADQLQFRVWDEHGTQWFLSGSADEADANTARKLLPTGRYVALATAGSQSSALMPLRVDATGESSDVVCELAPGSRIALVDEAGQPIPDAWIFIGTEATADFADPLPLFAVTDDAGMLSAISLPVGKYRAQLVHEKGSYEEWRVDFGIDVTGPQETVTVPLSKKVKTYK